MTDAIRPSLTPEQWDSDGPSVAVGTCPKLGIRARLFHRLRSDQDNVSPRESHVVDLVMYPGRSAETLDEADRLGLAAVCLHKHTQGFTRADAKALREVGFGAYHEDCGCGLVYAPERQKWLHSLAARIEALLPPEGA